MTKKQQKTTTEEFARFVKECKRQITRLGLTRWEVVYDHKRLPKSHYATCEYDAESFSAVMSYNTIKRDKDASPEVVARHECAELLLAPIVDVAESRFATQREFDKAKEAVVMTLEKVL